MKEKNCYRSNEASLCFGEENNKLFSWKEEYIFASREAKKHGQEK